jgi:hypothetical protein
MRIGGKNKIIDTLVNKYISYLMVTVPKKEYSEQLILKNRYGKQNYKERRNEKAARLKAG